MPFCSNCGAQVNEQHKFCPACGARLKMESKVTNKQSLGEAITWHSVFTFLILEVITIIGASPTFSEQRRTRYSEYTAYWALWDNWGASAAFLVIVTVLTLFLTRHTSRKIQVRATLVVLAILSVTALGIKALGKEAWR